MHHVRIDHAVLLHLVHQRLHPRVGMGVDARFRAPAEPVNKALSARQFAPFHVPVEGRGVVLFACGRDGRENKDAAWYYPQPKDAAKEIAGRVAFWKGVQVA